MKKDAWWKDGIRFECQQSGKCCVSHGEYGYVYLTREDRQNIARLLGISTGSFTRKYCQTTEGIYHLKDNGEACVFLKDRKCTVYEARPMQCRTWPFWPETMSAKSWTKDVVSFCPGIGKGPKWSAEKIAAALKNQSEWEEKLSADANVAEKS